MVTLESGLTATLADLKLVFDSNLSDDALKYWLNVGYSFLDPLLDWSDFTDAKKGRMEVLAAADAASSQDPRIYREAVGDADFRYQRDPNDTDYWRQLVAMDHTGKLSSVKGAPSADFQALGPGR